MDRKNVYLWLEEAAEGKVNKMNKSELSNKIDSLRIQLVIVADIYGFRSSELLCFSQYLDKYIVAYQKNGVM